jgi:hypothetical protein
MNSNLYNINNKFYIHFDMFMNHKYSKMVLSFIFLRNDVGSNSKKCIKINIRWNLWMF